MLYGKSWYFICHRDKKPVVAIFSTGNEILRHSEPLKPGYVWDANSYTLPHFVEDCGGMPLVVDIMRTI